MLINQWNRSTYSSQILKRSLQNFETHETENLVKSNKFQAFI